MTPRDYFGIIVRTVGLFLCLVGIYYFLFGLLRFRGTFSYLATTTLFQSGFSICVGLYLLRGAPALLRFTYPKPNDA